ncbi:MAG: RNA-directed DNA polymerase [Saprospiraceae bacterium]|nr:RNA-directed DNA polymerase [Saprospiraceae bacterium]
MKRYDHLLEAVAEPENLRLAFWKARKGKSHASQVEQYRNNLDDNLIELRKQILNEAVEVGDYHYFKIFEPKERQICASAFREQVLHHALMNVCHNHFERVQIFDSYACRKGKGTYAAIERAKTFTRQYDWFLKLDVRKFFETVHHQVLKRQLGCMFRDQALLGIFSKIIDSYEAHPERGLPIGNLTSQYFANHYLADLDHFIKEQLHCKAYVRYMDDMVLWHDDKTALKRALCQIRSYVNDELLCALKPEMLNRTALGLPFLGYRIFPHNMRLTQQSKRRFIRKADLAGNYLQSGVWDEATYQRHLLPLLAFVQHAETKGFRQKIFE